MSTVHIVRNQDGHYWGRGKRWVDGRDRERVASYKHRDEAVNTVFELSSKDIMLRCEVLDLELQEGKLPKLTVSLVPLPDDENAQLPLENGTGAPISTAQPDSGQGDEPTPVPAEE